MTLAKIVESAKPGKVGQRVKLVGWLVAAKRVRTVHGDYMKFLTMEGKSGIYEVTLFPKPYAKHGHALNGHGPYYVTGKVENDGGDVTVTAEGVGAMGRWSKE